jgi:FHA domain
MVCRDDRPGDVELTDVEVHEIMLKCPFCGFANEDGALFCEQCKSDISSVAPSSAPAAHAPTPMPDSLHPAETIPVAALEEDAPVMAAVLAEEEPPVVAILEEEPPVVGIVEEEPPVVAIIEEEPPVVAIVEEQPAVATLEEAPKPAAPPPPAPAAAPPKPAGAQVPIPAGAQIKLVVQRGLKVGEEYNLFAGENFIGRADEKPVDVDLTFQEPEDRVWCSRQHALIVYDDATGMLTIEDLNSSNGTFVNRTRVYPGQPCQLYAGNTIQIGTVHMRIKV